LTHEPAFPQSFCSQKTFNATITKPENTMKTKHPLLLILAAALLAMTGCESVAQKAEALLYKPAPAPAQSEAQTGTEPVALEPNSAVKVAVNLAEVSGIPFLGEVMGLIVATGGAYLANRRKGQLTAVVRGVEEASKTELFQEASKAVKRKIAQQAAKLGVSEALAKTVRNLTEK
jgi:hypothetical protein